MKTRRALAGLTPWLLALTLGIAGAAAADEAIEGYGMVVAKDMTERTVTIDGLKYDVTPGTSIRDRSGEPISLAEVLVQDVNSEPPFIYAYEARMEGGRLRLLELRMVRNGDPN
jgi:hypothetical protein